MRRRPAQRPAKSLVTPPSQVLVVHAAVDAVKCSSSDGGGGGGLPAPTEAELANLIGARLRELRARTSYTLDALASDCDLDKDYLSHVEAGENLPSVDVLATLAEHLGVGLVDLVAVDPTDAGAALLDAARRGDREAVLKCLRRLGLD